MQFVLARDLHRNIGGLVQHPSAQAGKEGPDLGSEKGGARIHIFREERNEIQ